MESVDGEIQSIVANTEVLAMGNKTVLLHAPAETLSMLQWHALRTGLADVGKGGAGDAPVGSTESTQGSIGRVLREPRASAAQERLWTLEHLGVVGTAYNLSVAVNLRGALDSSNLEQSLKELVIRHESLRTRFPMIGNEVVQRIHSGEDFSLQHADLRDGFSNSGQAAVLTWLNQHAERSFDLSEEPPFRAALARLSESEHALLLSIHHVVADGWSIGLLLREFTEIYTARVERRDPALPKIPVQYADYALWTRLSLPKDRKSLSARFWTEQLEGYQPLFLPKSRPFSENPEFSGDALDFSLDPEFIRRLDTRARALNATAFALLLAAFYVVLSRWSGQNDITIGVPFAGRVRPEIQGCVGLFVNILPFRIRAADGTTLEQLVCQVHQTAGRLWAHQEIPVQEALRLDDHEGDVRHQPLFTVVFNLLTGPAGGVEHLSLPRLTVEFLPLRNDSVHFDLSVIMQKGATGLQGMVQYSTHVFSEHAVASLCSHYTAVLEAFIERPESCINQVELLRQKEIALLDSFNGNVVRNRSANSIHCMFEAQVRRAPASIALVHRGLEITYATLNDRANRVARLLRSSGVYDGDLVGLCSERGVELVTGLLGILKAGAAYLPLDPKYPKQRLDYMVNDSCPRVLLTGDVAEVAVPEIRIQTVSMTEHARQIESGDSSDLGIVKIEGSLAYVMYTSGSTGRPKGVMVEERGVVNLLASMQRELGVTEFDRLLAVTSISFDISVLEIFLPLVSGATLIVADRVDVIDPQLLRKALSVYDSTILQATPITWRMLFDSATDVSWGQMRAVCGGEELLGELSHKIVGNAKALWNLYGPTETTIWSCSHRISIARPAGATESIGRPISNTQIYILDRYNRRAPVGVPGEICIGGAGVARGYVNLPGRTAESFVANPFSEGERLYRTGDVGRYLEDGSIEFLGRLDNQVKLRGHRVELGEIEMCLQACPGVQSAAVQLRKDMLEDRRLIAYYTSAPDAVVSAEELRKYVAAELPSHMIPAAFVRLAALPKTTNGKLDRKALPTPSVGDFVGRGYEAPKGEVETRIAEVWKIILGVSRVGRHDSFFGLGGHSMSVLQAKLRLQRDGFEVDVKTLFTSPVLSDLAARITRAPVTL